MSGYQNPENQFMITEKEYEEYERQKAQIATMRDLLIKCSNRLKAVSANAYDSESFSLHSEIETALERMLHRLRNK